MTISIPRLHSNEFKLALINSVLGNKKLPRKFIIKTIQLIGIRNKKRIIIKLTGRIIGNKTIWFTGPIEPSFTWLIKNLQITFRDRTTDAVPIMRTISPNEIIDNIEFTIEW